MIKSIFIISAQFGGPNATDRFKPFFLNFKKIVESHCKNKYSDEILELSYIFRVDGNISSWNTKGCNRMRLMKKQNYITIDIGISSAILEMDELEIWDFVWVEFSKGLNMMLKKIQSQRIDFDADQLIKDLEEQVEGYRRINSAEPPAVARLNRVIKRCK